MPFFPAGASLISEDSKGRQCAHLAAMRNKKKILQLLFDHGVDLDCRCEAGKTPIHYAAQYGGMFIWLCMESIRKTCPCNEYPIKPNFYKVKLGFEGYT